MVASLEERNRGLTQELEWIQQPVLTDKWFYVRPEDGRLGLYDKPTTIWGLICEFFSRIFCPDKYDCLDRKVEVLTQQINDYLSEEEDGGRLDPFLCNNTVTLNALYNAMFKLSERRRIRSFDIAPESPIKELVLYLNGKTTNFFMVKNGSAQPMSLQIGMAGRPTMYQQAVVKPDKSAGALLLGEPGYPWQVNVDGLAKGFRCPYASAEYSFNFANPNVVQASAEPFRTKFFEEQYEKVSSDQHRVTFSGVKPFTTETHDTGERSIFISNESGNIVRVEITVINPKDDTQQLTIKPFVLLQENKKLKVKIHEKEIEFSDPKFKERGIERGQRYFDALAKEEELIYVIRFIEYSKLTHSTEQ